MRYGCIPDTPDARDFPVHQGGPLLRLGKTHTLLPVVDLRSRMSAVRDQVSLGSCTAFALCGLRESIEIEACRRAGAPPTYTTLSPLDLYYWERVAEGDVTQDNGAQLRTGLKVLLRAGVAPERDDPYDPARFATGPTKQASEDALQFTISAYYRIFTLDQLRNTLHYGHPAVIGFQVFESFESDAVAKTGMVPMPEKGEHCLGGHAVLVCGYDDVRRVVCCKNSWSAEWGDGGYFTLPYGFWSGTAPLTDDMWTAIIPTVGP